MIYSTNYAELYRRAVNGESVLCFVWQDGDYQPAEAGKAGTHVWVSSLGREYIDYTNIEERFISECQRLNLRFVPDNEGLVNWCESLLSVSGAITNIDIQISELQTILKQYE